jgi:hypothetical protein
MNSLKLSLLAAIGSLALAGAAQAQDVPAVKAAFNVGANTDYVFRGVTHRAQLASAPGATINVNAGGEPRM